MSDLLLHYNGTYSENAGVSKVLLSLGKQLKVEKTEVSYLYGYGSKNSYLKLLKGKFHLLHYTPITALLFARWFFGKRFDVVYSHCPESAFDVIVTRFLLGAKYKVVVHLYGLDVVVRSEWKKEVASGSIDYSFKTDLYLLTSVFKSWFAFKFADSFVAVSNVVAFEAKELYGVEAKIILNSVDCNDFEVKK